MRGMAQRNGSPEAPLSCWGPVADSIGVLTTTRNAGWSLCSAPSCAKAPQAPRCPLQFWRPRCLRITSFKLYGKSLWVLLARSMLELGSSSCL